MPKQTTFLSQGQARIVWEPTLLLLHHLIDVSLQAACNFVDGQRREGLLNHDPAPELRLKQGPCSRPEEPSVKPASMACACYQTAPGGPHKDTFGHSRRPMPIPSKSRNLQSKIISIFLKASSSLAEKVGNKLTGASESRLGALASMFYEANQAQEMKSTQLKTSSSWS